MAFVLRGAASTFGGWQSGVISMPSFSPGGPEMALSCCAVGFESVIAYVDLLGAEITDGMDNDPQRLEASSLDCCRIGLLKVRGD